MTATNEKLAIAEDLAFEMLKSLEMPYRPGREAMVATAVWCLVYHTRRALRQELDWLEPVGQVQQ
jgi:hypothetical protein